MGLNFPQNPTSGQVYTYNNESWTWNGTAWIVSAGVQTYAPVHISASPPRIAIAGDLWFDKNNGFLYVYYTDQDSSQWISATQQREPIVEVPAKTTVDNLLEVLTPYTDITTAVAAGTPTGALFKITDSTTVEGIRAVSSYAGSGVKGDKGEKGETGAGTKGEKGEAGSGGLAGAKGQKGDDGTNGTNGTNGTDGAKGQKGDDGAGTPAGADTELQFNNAGAFGGIPGLSFASGSNTLTAGSRINNTNQFMDFTSTDTAQALQVYGATSKEFDIKVGDDVGSLGIVAKFTPGNLTLPSGELDANTVDATIFQGARQGMVYKLIVGSGLTFEGQASTHIGGTVGNDWATSSGTIGVNASVVQITGDASIAGNKKFLADLKIGTALADNITLGTDGGISALGLSVASISYPTSDGTAGQVLQTDGAGTLSFATVSGGGTPAGNDTEIQFNNGGAFGASSQLTFTGTALGAPSIVSALFVGGSFQASTSFVPNTDLGADLGTSTAKFDESHVNTANAVTLAVSGNATIGGNTTLGDANTDTITFTGEIDSHYIPTTNATYDLGDAEHKIRHLFLSDNSLKIGPGSDDTISVEVGASDTTQNLTVNKGIEVVGNILPTVTNAADLGGPSLKWNNGYFNLLHAGNYAFPTAVGTNGQVLASNGTNLTFQDVLGTVQDWTATLKGLTTEPGTLVTATGKYVQNGNVITASVELTSFDSTGYAGNFSITGLPVAASSAVGGTGTIRSTCLDTSAVSGTVAMVTAGTSIIKVFGSTTGSSLNWDSSTGAGNSLNLTITYIV